MKNIIFETKEQYLETINAWKETCKDKTFQFKPEHFALYAIIRDKDPKKCFASPLQQSHKKLIYQGKSGLETYEMSMSRILDERRHMRKREHPLDDDLIAPFKGKLTKDDLEKIRTILEGGSHE